MIDLKSRVEKVTSKFEMLKFEKNAATLVADSSDDSDMEEVVVPVRVADEELMACYKDDPLAVIFSKIRFRICIGAS